MWIIKGIAVGVPLFLILTVIYMILRLHASGAGAIGLTALRALTVQNPCTG